MVTLWHKWHPRHFTPSCQKGQYNCWALKIDKGSAAARSAKQSSHFAIIQISTFFSLWANFNFYGQFFLSLNNFFSLQGQFFFVGLFTSRQGRLLLPTVGPKWRFWFFFLNYTKPSRLNYIWPVESIFQGFQILGLRFQGQKKFRVTKRILLQSCIVKYVWGENVMCVREHSVESCAILFSLGERSCYA